MKRETDRPDRIGPYRVLDVLGKGAMDNAPLLTELAALLETSGRGDEAARLHARADSLRAASGRD